MAAVAPAGRNDGPIDGEDGNADGSGAEGPLDTQLSRSKRCAQMCTRISEAIADYWETVKSQKLDTALVIQERDTLVVLTHRVASKVFGVTMWFALIVWLLTVFYGAAAYSLGQEMRWSPRYMEQRQWEALNEIDRLLSGEAEVVLMMNHTRVIPAPVYGIGNFWWPFVLIVGTCICCVSCCGPSERRLTFDRAKDKWWVEETKYSFSDFCVRCDCWMFGKPLVIAAATLSDTYVDLSLEDRTQGTAGCGPTRWSTHPPTPSIKLRQLSDGTVRHVVDADAVMCCYDSRCCLDEGTVHMQGLAHHLRSFLAQVHKHLELAISMDGEIEAGGDIQTADEILDARLKFSKLHKLDPLAQEEDYRTQLGIWDVEGVVEDTRIVVAKTIAEGHEIRDDNEDNFEAVLQSTNGEHLFAWLQKFDLEACREDYFLLDRGWDVAGIRSDLEHAKARTALEQLQAKEDRDRHPDTDTDTFDSVPPSKANKKTR